MLLRFIPARRLARLVRAGRLARPCRVLLLLLGLLTHRATATPEDTLLSTRTHTQQFLEDRFYSLFEDPSGTCCCAW